MRLLIPYVLPVLVLSLSSVGLCQLPRHEVERLGMELAWQGQVQLPAAGQGIVSSHLWLDPTQIRQYAVVELEGGRTIRIAADELDSRGQPLGLEGAKQQAAEQAARLLGKNEGFDVVEANIPQSRLVFITNDGLVQNFDAETGSLIWSSVCGSIRAPAHPGVVSAAGVALIHGRNLYLLDWQTGKQRMITELPFGSAVTLAACDDLVYVSDFRGRIQALGLGTPRKSWSSKVIGRTVGRPVTLLDQSHCAIATSEGYVYTFLGGENPGIWSRYQTPSGLHGSLAAGNGAFYAGTGDGVLTKIGIDGMGWEYPAGETISVPAFVSGDRVVVATEGGDLHCIDDATGYRVWSITGQRFTQPFAQMDGKYLCRTAVNEICAVDAKTGKIVFRTQPTGITKIVHNQLTDRVYLVGTYGQVQCLRLRGADLPHLYRPVDSEQAPQETAPAAAGQSTAPATGDNPFNFGAPAGGSNPFGGDASGDASGAAGSNPFGSEPSSAGGTNPFGAEANPFGAGDAAMGGDSSAGGQPANPFGASDTSNPFGGANPF